MQRPILNLLFQGACTAATGTTIDFTNATVTGLSASSDVKDSVRLATAAVLPNSPTYLGGVLTAGTNSTLTVDGSVCALNDRVLVKNQVATANNGIYYLSQLGSGAAPWKLTRALDFDLWTEIPGSVVSVEAGTVNAGTQWLCNVVAGGTIGSTAISFVVPKNFVDLTTSQTVTGTKTFTTPVLGEATATSINGVSINGSGYFITLGNNIVSVYSGGEIDLSGDTSAGAGGDIYTYAQNGNNGGNIDTHADQGAGGNIDTSGYYGQGGSINTSSLGGNIDTSGSGANAGGSINTSGGGGSIDTTGNGSIGLGIVANRTYLVSTAGNNEKTATFPNVTGTVAVGAHSATTTHAMFSAGAAGYTTRAIATADIATALTTPGAIGGTTASTGAFTTVTLPVNNANYVPTLNLGGNKGLIGETNYVTVVNGTAYIVAFNASGSIVNCDLVANPTNSKSCGTTGGRWSNVFSVLGNFSGAVTCSTTLAVTSTTTMTGRLTANGGITVVGGSYLLTTNSALANTTGSGAGTLTNAPDAGNPTKWIAINDYGTERYIPTWEFPPPP